METNTNVQDALVNLKHIKTLLWCTAATTGTPENVRLVFLVFGRSDLSINYFISIG